MKAMEPTNLTSAYWQERCDALLARVRASKNFRPDPPVYRCSCEDVGFRATSEANTVVPCERCRPDVYKNWMAGRYKPNSSHREVTADEADRRRNQERFGSRKREDF